MTNRANSRQHGLSSANQQRPKSKNRKRANKVKARVRSAERHAKIAEKVTAAKGGSAKKVTE